ncbi:hypothetical protein [Bradyrhizobium sp. HKCCYLR20261]|uniref:hypothetical protein n=1 Tax=Bradyrhizobium sp. HKCCYLR20261 TaxID=3420760 RepID=UPI003EC06066
MASQLKAPTELQWDDRLSANEREAVEEWNACIARLNEARAVEINIAGPFLRSRIAWKLATYQHALLHRVVALADGVAVNWNGRSVLGAMLCARALMETIAVFSFVERSAAALYEREDLGGLDAIGQNGTFATRDEALLKEFPESKATNILTYVKRFDEEVLPGFGEHYDRLSERCHPNTSGHYFMFATLNRNEGRINYSDDAAPQRSSGLILAALAVTPFVESLHPRMSDLVMKIADLQHRVAPLKDDGRSDSIE